MKTGWISLAAVCALVLGVYAYMAQSGPLELLSPTAADTYYNLLVQGFRAGQLSSRASPTRTIRPSMFPTWVHRTVCST
ncbi:MAG: hypothetical protein ABSH14_01240 [Verrucomicrobiia bacterium]